LNGKVERSQKTDLDEFYSTVDLADMASGVAAPLQLGAPAWVAELPTTNRAVL
jgi:hypothetical protein